MSKNHSGIMWVCACAPHLWFVPLPNWHFSLQLPLLQHPCIWAVDNFQRFRFGRINLYDYIYIANHLWYLKRFWTTTDNDEIITLYLIHTLSIVLSAFYRASNQLIHRNIEPSNHQTIKPSIHRSIDQYIDSSIDPSILRSIHQLIVTILAE